MTLSVAAVLSQGLAARALAAPPAASGPTRTALFQMYCYWTGEATLGRVPGVVRTRIGELSGEVVEVEYDPARTDLGQLAGALRQQGGFSAVVVQGPLAKTEALRFLPATEIRETDRRPRFLESKYNLRTSHADLYALGLSESQAIALNSWSYFGGPMPDVLTAEQKQKLAEIRQRSRESANP